MTKPRWIGSEADGVIGYYLNMPLARSALPAGQQPPPAITEALRSALRPHQGADGVLLGSAAWLVAARR